MFAGSAGLLASQPLRSFDQASPPTMIGWVAPVARTAFTSDCIPAVFQAGDPVEQPLSQHDQLMSCGSLKRSNSTVGSDL